MKEIVKYILVIISILLVVLFFIKFLNITNEGFYTNGNLLNKIKPGCDPTHPKLRPTNDSNNCDCSGKYIDQYALYNSKDDKKYNSIVKCEYINKDKSEWSKVTNEIYHNPIGYRDCNPSHSNPSNNNSDYKYACQPKVNSNVFALWDGKQWITSNAREPYNSYEYDWVTGRNYPQIVIPQPPTSQPMTFQPLPFFVKPAVQTTTSGPNPFYMNVLNPSSTGINPSPVNTVDNRQIDMIIKP